MKNFLKHLAQSAGLQSFLLFLFIILIISSAAEAQPQDTGYDPYTEKLRTGSYEKEKDRLAVRIANAPAVPLEITKKAIEKALIYIEKYHIDRKVKWVFDELHERGFYPTGDQLEDRPHTGVYLLWKKDKLIKASPYVEYAGFNAWTGVNTRGYNEHAGEVVLDNILKTGLYAKQLFKYENRPQEDFFGVGHQTSLGESFSYDLEGMHYLSRFGGKVGLPWGKLTAEGIYGFHDVKISNGQDDSKHAIQDFFKEPALAGVNGGDYHSIGVSVIHDDRDDEEIPHCGGYRKFTVLYNEGTDGSQFEFVKYKFEAAQFFPVFRKENIAAIRFAGETNDQRDGGSVPFFEMARLGGYKNLRGFQFNRFFDDSALWMSFEYRYNIWQYREFRVDMVPFLDIGSVFGESGDFELSNTRFSYGGAARVFISKKMKLDLEIAHSNEGTEVYIKYGAPF